MSSTQPSDEMRVVKRDGTIQVVSFDKILRRIKTIGSVGTVGTTGSTEPIKINYTQLTMKIIDQLYDMISTTKIDELTADQCASMSSIHYDYGILAARIIISNCHRNTDADFVTVMKKLHNYKDKHGANAPLVTRDLVDFAKTHTKCIKSRIDCNRDFLFDYFGFKTLERSYLMRINGIVVERPQHMWMRVALSIHKDDIEAALETYDMMSQKYFTHATPTLFNAGTPRPQLSSCFLIAMEEDSIAGIYNTLKDCALISKWAGGIGLHIHNVRASNSHIRGTNGSSNGIVPMLRVFNNTAKYVDQCLDPETIVYTKRGPVKIKNIIIGDEVVTDDGNCYSIRKVLDYPEYKGDFYTIDVKYSLFPLKLTDMHPLWVIKNNKYIQTYFDDIISDLNKGLIVPDFVEAKNVDKNDFVGFPIPKWEQDIPQFTEDDCRMYGIMIGDGNMSSTKNLCYVSLNTETKQDIIEFVEKYLGALGIHITYSENNKNVRLVFSRNNMFKFTYEMVYDENKEKRILPNMLHLPKNKTLNVIKGILETDAKISNHQISLEMTSFNVVESVRYMLLRLGILSSGSVRNRAGQTHVTIHGKTITNKKPTATLLIPKKEIICKLFPNKNLECSKKLKFFEHNGYLFSIVNSNQKTENYSGRVIDIEVDNENHHNFLTHNGLVKNGGGKRNGSFAIYLEPWHADIELFLEMRKNHGDEELKARDLFYALWIPDLFMERVKTDGTWTLLCPDECPGLADVHGDAFVALYTKYENDNVTPYKCRKTVKARDLWFKVLDAQMETGTPYLCYKDAANAKSNQSNLGTIKSSNLCSEIIEYSDENETAVCNLASIGLPTFCVRSSSADPTAYAGGKPIFDYAKLHEVTQVITRNLNKVIDINYYPTEKTRISNMRHRPIGIGVQGLADVFMLLDLPFHSDEAKEINQTIFETIYHGALTASAEAAEKDGPYETFHNGTNGGCPASRGILQYHMWNVQPKYTNHTLDWTALKARIQQVGLRNSLLVAPMPTASTSQILGFNECFEPFTSNIYSRRTLAGEFVLTNKYLMRDLIQAGLWNTDLKNSIVGNQGSVQHIEGLSQHLKDKYKTVWEIPMKHLIDMAADRGAFICQSQSLNLWLEDPNYNMLTSMHFYAWQKGLKTGIYYLRRRAKHRAQQFTIEPEQTSSAPCEMCSA
jgi:ribonucleoside-diphosphate reductase alpha subunit